MDIGYYYQRGGKQHGEQPEVNRGEFTVYHDGKTWVYEKPKHAKKREIRNALLAAFGERRCGKLTGRYPTYYWDTF